MRTGANAGWKVVSATTKGAGHSSLHRPNQDREITRALADGTTWVYAVADGAGSRARSDHGALLAVEAAATAADLVFGRGVPDSVDGWRAAATKFAKESLDVFDRRVDSDVQGLRGLMREPTGELRASYATTLLAVVSAPPFFAYVNVGDCFLVVDRDPGGPFLVVTAPEREHAGETVFLTSRHRGAHVTHGVIMDARIRGVALCTDGLGEGMLANRQTPDGRLHSLAPPEFSAYFDYFGAPGTDDSDLAAKIMSKEFAETSGDDKTIVMAVRRS
jgi:hypothetical protein